MAKTYETVKNTLNTNRKSFIIRHFGYSKSGASYKKTSVDVNDTMLVKCNFNYVKDKVYQINMNDPYAKDIVGDAVNDMPLHLQNPDVYLKLSYLFAFISGFIFLVYIVGYFLLMYINMEDGLAGTTLLSSVILLRVLPLPVLLFLIFTIIYLITIGKYSQIMRRCAYEICTGYYKKIKEEKEKAEFNAIIGSRQFLSACPNCGYENNDSKDHCPMCGSQMWKERSETEISEVSSDDDLRFWFDECPRCGLKRVGNIENCRACGTRMWQEFED